MRWTMHSVLSRYCFIHPFMFLISFFCFFLLFRFFSLTISIAPRGWPLFSFFFMCAAFIGRIRIRGAFCLFSLQLFHAAISFPLDQFISLPYRYIWKRWWLRPRVLRVPLLCVARPSCVRCASLFCVLTLAYIFRLVGYFSIPFPFIYPRFFVLFNFIQTTILISFDSFFPA